MINISIFTLVVITIINWWSPELFCISINNFINYVRSGIGSRKRGD